MKTETPQWQIIREPQQGKLLCEYNPATRTIRVKRGRQFFDASLPAACQYSDEKGVRPRPQGGRSCKVFMARLPRRGVLRRARRPHPHLIQLKRWLR